MPPGPAQNVGPAEEERAQAPIRWPHPDRLTLALIVVWVVGLIIALAVPALIVPPTAQHPSTGQTWFAFSFTLIGVVIMLVASVVHYRREHDPSIFTLAASPPSPCSSAGSSSWRRSSGAVSGRAAERTRPTPAAPPVCRG